MEMPRRRHFAGTTRRAWSAIHSSSSPGSIPYRSTIAFGIVTRSFDVTFATSLSSKAGLVVEKWSLNTRHPLVLRPRPSPHLTRRAASALVFALDIGEPLGPGMSRRSPHATARRNPATTTPWRIHFFQRHEDDDPKQTVPARDFIDRCPSSVAAKLVAVVKAVADAPPPAFSGGGKWEAMHGDMNGFYGARGRTQAPALPALLPTRPRRRKGRARRG
jgi:hypothetical protein